MNLSDNELMAMVNRTFDDSKSEDENFDKIVSIFYSLVKESYKNGDISLIIAANKFDYSDSLQAINSLNSFVIFLDKCGIEFDQELERKIKKETLDLDSVLKKACGAKDADLRLLSGDSIELINNSSYSILNTTSFEENIDDLDDYEYKELSDEEYEKIIDKASFPNDSTKQYFKDISRISKLSEDEKQTLYKKYAETKDPKIRERLIIGNLRLVVSIASKYQKYSNNFTLLELISFGNEGIITALDYYNPEKAKFSTYAIWWIRQKISRGIADDSLPFRIPVNLRNKIYSYIKQKSILESNYGRKLTIQELSEETGIPAKKINDYEKLLVKMNSVSIDAPVGEEEDSSLIDFIPDSDTLTPEQYTISNDKTYVNRLLSCLNDVERKVIVLRYGLDDGIRRNFGEVSEELYLSKEKNTRLTRQRIEQIESKALRKMKDYIERSKNMSNRRFDFMRELEQGRTETAEINKINMEFLKLVKLIKTTKVPVLSKSISQLESVDVDVLKICFGNIYAGVPLAPALDMKKRAAFRVFPLLMANIIRNEKIEKEVDEEEFELPRNIYDYFSGNSSNDIDKAIVMLSTSERLLLSKYYDVYTGDFIADKVVDYHDARLISNALKIVEFNLPGGKAKIKK